MHLFTYSIKLNKFPIKLFLLPLYFESNIFLTFVHIWELDHKERSEPKKWWFWTVVDKTLESPLESKEIKSVKPKGNQPWISFGRTVAEPETPVLQPADEELTLWKRSWCWKRLKAKGERSGRGWDGWMASLTQWTWVWVNSGRQWKTEKFAMLQPMGSQRVGHNLVTEQQQN